jgi:hypothetical protein
MENCRAAVAMVHFGEDLLAPKHIMRLHPVEAISEPMVRTIEEDSDRRHLGALDHGLGVAAEDIAVDVVPRLHLAISLDQRYRQRGNDRRVHHAAARNTRSSSLFQ